MWIEKSYQLTGAWSIEEKGGKSFFSLGEDFRTIPGPDLKLYLSKLPMEKINNRDSIDLEGLYLGALMSATGAQRYEIPSEIDLNDFASAVVHCRQFSVVWGGVDLR